MKRTRRWKRQLIKAISEILGGLAVGVFILALTWAFWVLGDAGPDKVFNVLALIALAFGAASLFVDWLGDQMYTNKRRERNAHHRRV